MGTEIVKCCTQTLTTEEDDGEDSESSIALSETAKNLYEMKENKSVKYNHLDVAYNNDLNKRSKKSVSTIKGCNKRSISDEDELDAIQIKLREQRKAIKLLKKQNEFLRKQNEEFILKYGSFFSSYPATETSINSLHSQHSSSSITDTQISNSNGHHIFGTPKRIDLDLKVSINNTEELINNVPISSSSPLTALTNNQTNIILSYSNTDSISFPDTPNTPNTTNNNKRTPICTLPILNDSNKDEIIDLYNNNDECMNIGSCQSFKRIIITLQWYSICNGDYNVLLQKIMDNKYNKYLIDDYQHIIHHHKKYKLIQNEINKQIEPCHTKTCNGYKKYHQSSKKMLSLSQNKEFCIDVIDLIHCYLMHSYDLQ